MDKDLEVIAPFAADFLEWLNGHSGPNPRTARGKSGVPRPLSTRQRDLMADSIADVLFMHQFARSIREPAPTEQSLRSDTIVRRIASDPDFAMGRGADDESPPMGARDLAGLLGHEGCW